MTDAELVAQLKANDDDAYREVVARFGDPLYGYIFSITGDHHLSDCIFSVIGFSSLFHYQFQNLIRTPELQVHDEN